MLKDIKNYLIGLIAGIFALLGLYLKGKSAGKDEERAKQNERVLDDVKKVNIARADSGKRARVRNKYSR